MQIPSASAACQVAAQTVSSTRPPQIRLTEFIKWVFFSKRMLTKRTYAQRASPDCEVMREDRKWVVVWSFSRRLGKAECEWEVAQSPATSCMFVMFSKCDFSAWSRELGRRSAACRQQSSLRVALSVHTSAARTREGPKAARLVPAARANAVRTLHYT